MKGKTMALLTVGLLVISAIPVMIIYENDGCEGDYGEIYTCPYCGRTFTNDMDFIKHSEMELNKATQEQQQKKQDNEKAIIFFVIGLIVIVAIAYGIQTSSIKKRKAKKAEMESKKDNPPDVAKRDQFDSDEVNDEISELREKYLKEEEK